MSDPSPPEGREPSANRLDFARLAARPEASLDLATGCLHIAAEAYPGLSFGPILGELDLLAGRVRERLGGEASTAEIGAALAALHAVLYGEYGLRGDRESYDDPRNSLLNDVLARRLGLPITLAVVELEVAWRVGLPLHGIGFPGRFLVGGPGELVIDPFDAGRRLAPDDLEALLRRARREPTRHEPGAAAIPVALPVALHAALLRPATKRGILGRILRNLHGSFVRRREWGSALWSVELLGILDPDDPDLLRDRAVLLARAGRFAAAVAGLRRYLEARPDADDAELVRRAIAAFRSRVH